MNEATETEPLSDHAMMAVIEAERRRLKAEVSELSRQIGCLVEQRQAVFNRLTEQNLALRDIKQKMFLAKRRGTAARLIGG